MSDENGNGHKTARVALTGLFGASVGKILAIAVLVVAMGLAFALGAYGWTLAQKVRAGAPPSASPSPVPALRPTVAEPGRVNPSP